MLALTNITPDSMRVHDPTGTLTYRIDRPRPYVLVTEIVTPDLPFGGRWTWAPRAGYRLGQKAPVREA